ncbi:MAG TPA: class I SAM-dependent methyltransferase [Vitreimonas sp.]|nr:class I SAM-dependent methyltransferase [Vitreimonas sp.]
MTDRDEFLATNRALWDEWTSVHERSAFYDLEGFKRGGVRIADHEIEEIGPVDGRSLLHLQCHFGLDTLSWARLGAQVTGIDFSPKAVALARSLADELHLAARFIESDVYRLPEVLDESFDLVYTSNGVLGWLPDVARWGEIVARYLKPGGRFYILEIHPVAQALENEGVAPGELRLAYPYWEHANPLAFPVQGSYADRSASLETETEYGWNHSLGEIVTALADAGLRIEKLREYPFVNWKLDFCERRDDGRYYLPPGDGELPLMFSVLATKPGRPS